MQKLQISEWPDHADPRAIAPGFSPRPEIRAKPSEAPLGSRMDRKDDRHLASHGLQRLPNALEEVRVVNQALPVQRQERVASSRRQTWPLGQAQIPEDRRAAGLSQRCS